MRARILGSTYRAPGQKRPGRRAGIIGEPAVIGDQMKATWGVGSAVASVSTGGIPSDASSSSIVATSPPRTTNTARRQACLKLRGEWSESRREPSHLRGE